MNESEVNCREPNDPKVFTSRALVARLVRQFVWLGVVPLEAATFAARARPLAADAEFVERAGHLRPDDWPDPVYLQAFTNVPNVPQTQHIPIQFVQYKMEVRCRPFAAKNETLTKRM